MLGNDDVQSPKLQKYLFKKEYAYFGAYALSAQFLPFQIFGRDVNTSTASAALNTRAQSSHACLYKERQCATT